MRPVAPAVAAPPSVAPRAPAPWSRRPSPSRGSRYSSLGLRFWGDPGRLCGTRAATLLVRSDPCRGAPATTLVSRDLSPMCSLVGCRPLLVDPTVCAFCSAHLSAGPTPDAVRVWLSPSCAFGVLLVGFVPTGALPRDLPRRALLSPRRRAVPWPGWCWVATAGRRRVAAASVPAYVALTLLGFSPCSRRLSPSLVVSARAFGFLPGFGAPPPTSRAATGRDSCPRVASAGCSRDVASRRRPVLRRYCGPAGSPLGWELHARAAQATDPEYSGGPPSPPRGPPSSSFPRRGYSVLPCSGSPRLPFCFFAWVGIPPLRTRFSSLLPAFPSPPPFSLFLFFVSRVPASITTAAMA